MSFHCSYTASGLMGEPCRNKAVLAPKNGEHEAGGVQAADKQSHTHKAHQALWLPCFYQGEAVAQSSPPTAPGAGSGAWCSLSPQRPWPGLSIAPAPTAGCSSSALGEKTALINCISELWGENSTDKLHPQHCRDNSTDNAGLRGS